MEYEPRVGREYPRQAHLLYRGTGNDCSAGARARSGRPLQGFTLARLVSARSERCLYADSYVIKDADWEAKGSYYSVSVPIAAGSGRLHGYSPRPSSVEPAPANAAAADDYRRLRHASDG
jgi:hypothetical protein